MVFELNKEYIIMSKDRKLIAKGIVGKKVIYVVDEPTERHILSYDLKKSAKNSIKGDNFDLSEGCRKYIEEKYPDIAGTRFRTTQWNEEVAELFEVVTVKVAYVEVD